MFPDPGFICGIPDGRCAGGDPPLGYMTPPDGTGLLPGDFGFGNEGLSGWPFLGIKAGIPSGKQ